MRVRCISNMGTLLPESYLKPELCITHETTFQITIGKEYTVYAFYEWQANIWYYICDDNYIYYPIHTPAYLFEVIDSRLSAYWRFNLASNGLLEVAFEQWFTRPDFYERLTDGHKEEILIFNKIKALIDEEAFSG